MNEAQTQGNQVDYQLHTIGWKSFQDLCLTIIGEIRGQNIQVFNPTHDGGRDGAFCGTWTGQEGELISGSCTIQCKFSTKDNQLLKVADLNDEYEKAQRLANEGLANTYLLYTNLSLMGTVAGDLKQKFESIDGLNHFEAYGKELIARTIQDNARLRRLVPRVYGLGDLSQILDERAYDQAKSILSTLSHDLSKFVKTSAYLQSAKALNEKSFVLLLGEPACGKTTIAATLALGAIDCSAHHVININEPSQIADRWNPNEANQLFWVDDAFGSTQLDRQRLEAWNQAMKTITAAMDKGAKFILTSRDYIFKSAKTGLKTSTCPVFNDSQVHVLVEKIQAHEKEQILYNHLKFGAQPKEFKTRVKPFLSQLAKRQAFTPELARRLGDKKFTKTLALSETYFNHFVDVDEWMAPLIETISLLDAHAKARDEASLNRFIDEPMFFLKEVINSLDVHAKSAIALIFMRGGRLESPRDLTDFDQNAIMTLGSEQSQLAGALESLKDSLIVQEYFDGQMYWKYKHPTIKDAFSSIVADNSEYLDIYLKGAPIEQIMKEVSCGADVQGAKIIVSANRYEKIIHKMDFSSASSWEQRSLLHYFLAERCGKVFLEKFLAFNTWYLNGLTVWSYLSISTEIDVLARLKSLDLLPEDVRLKTVQQISDLAVDMPDAGFLKGNARNLLDEDEVQTILGRVKNELLPDLHCLVDNLASDYDSEESPDSHFAFLLEAVN